MADTVFTDFVTPVPAAWLNDVNKLTYSGIGPGAVPGAKLMTYKPSGTGSLTTTVQDRGNLVVWAEDFGHSTVASAAVNDAALLAAMTAVYAAGGGTVNMGTGTFLHDTVAFSWAASVPVNLTGSGNQGTTLRKTAVNTNPILNFSGSASPSSIFSEFSNFQIAGTVAQCDGLRLTLCANWTVRNVRAVLCDVGLNFVGSLIGTINNCQPQVNNTGIKFTKSGVIYPNNISIFGCVINSNTLLGIDAGDIGSLVIIGGDIESNGTTATVTTGGIRFRSSIGVETGTCVVIIQGIWMEGSKGWSIFCEDAAPLNLTMQSCRIHGSESSRDLTVGVASVFNYLGGNLNGSSTIGATRSTFQGGYIGTLTDNSGQALKSNFYTAAKNFGNEFTSQITAMGMPVFTTAGKNALTNMVDGNYLLDSTLGKMCFYYSGAWHTVTSV